jgi:predicted dinucleotide-binding enzyme
MAFGTLSADLFVSSANRSPEPAVLFYVTDDDRAGQEVERLIRTADFEPVKERLTGTGRPAASATA